MKITHQGIKLTDKKVSNYATKRETHILVRNRSHLYRLTSYRRGISPLKRKRRPTENKKEESKTLAVVLVSIKFTDKILQMMKNNERKLKEELLKSYKTS